MQRDMIGFANLEFILDYGDSELLALGEMFISDELGKMEHPDVKELLKVNLCRFKNGE
jgi:hypothetical protein